MWSKAQAARATRGRQPTIPTFPHDSATRPIPPASRARSQSAPRARCGRIPPGGAGRGAGAGAPRRAATAPGLRMQWAWRAGAVGRSRLVLAGERVAAGGQAVWLRWVVHGGSVTVGRSRWVDHGGLVCIFHEFIS
jgi:hypothetical protein